jgi:hypothetical protein
MAAETPFGASFGDPRRYMGKSPLAEIGNAAKSFLTGYAIQESGLEKWLNEKGVKRNQQGGYGYSAPAGAVAPTAAASPAAVQPPQTPFTPSFVPVAPSAAPQTNVPAVQNDMPPPDIGDQILNGTWTGFPPAPQPAGPTSLRNPTDFNPLGPDTSNQFAVSGNDYMNIPGYGSAQDKAGKLMKLMGMG